MQEVKRSGTRIYTKIVGLFLILTIAAIFLILHFALAKATIKIYSDLTDKTSTVLVEIQPEDTLEVSPEAIFGKIIPTEFELEVSVDTTQTKVEGKKAAGYVNIINDYSQDQPLIKTTRLLTPDDKLYRITEGVTVPAGGQVKVWAEADQEGSEFVIEQTSFIIPGLWEGIQDKVYATSVDKMELQSLPTYTINQADLDKVQEQLELQATENSLAIINELLSDKLKIAEDRLFLNYETLESSDLGDEDEQTTLKQKVTAYGLVFSQDDLADRAQEKYEKELESNQSLVEFKDFNYSVLEINPETNKAVLEVNITATINSNKSAWEIDKEQLVGKNKEEVEAYLKEQLNIEGAEVEFFPFWVKKVPRLKDHIIIE